MRIFFCQKKTDSLHIKQYTSKLGRRQRQKHSFAFSAPLNTNSYWHFTQKLLYRKYPLQNAFLDVCGKSTLRLSWRRHQNWKKNTAQDKLTLVCLSKLNSHNHFWPSATKSPTLVSLLYYSAWSQPGTLRKGWANSSVAVSTSRVTRNYPATASRGYSPLAMS